MIEDYKKFMEECVSSFDATNTNKHGHKISVEQGKIVLYFGTYLYDRIVIRDSKNEFVGVIKVKKNPYRSCDFDYKYEVEFMNGLGNTAKYMNDEKELKDFVLKLLQEFVEL